MAKDILIETSHGKIEVRLDDAKAPISTQNFLAYVRKHHYDGTIFHRVIPGFMIQGGGFAADMTKKPTEPPIAIESSNGRKNVRGTLAMARTNDPNSATCQFFINVVDNAFLDYQPGPGREGYAVFGEVTAGMEVVDAIREVPTKTVGGHENVPAEPVVIHSIREA